jgi:hypothetical protein
MRRNKNLLALSAMIAMAFAASNASAALSLGSQTLSSPSLPVIETVPEVTDTSTVTEAANLTTLTEPVISNTLISEPMVPEIIPETTSTESLVSQTPVAIPDITEVLQSSSDPLAILGDTSALQPVSLGALEPVTSGSLLSDVPLTISGPAGLELDASNLLNGQLSLSLLGLSLNVDLYGNVSPVPEPSSYAMLFVGLLGLGLARRRLGSNPQL